MDLLYNTPIKENRPIKLMPENKEWTMNIGTRFTVENKPPLRRVYSGFTLVSEYTIGDAENERIAIIYMYLNGACGTQQKLAKAWGIHYNTINNYIAAYRSLGLKGLTNQYYQPAERRESAEKDKEMQENITEQVTFFAQNNTTKTHIKDDPAIAKQEIHEPIITETIESEYGGNMLYMPLVNEMYQNILPETEKMDNQLSSTQSRIFGLKQILLTLIFYVFIGISCPEQGKVLRRKDFGVLIGEKQSPCCRTLRTGLNMLTVEGFPQYIGNELTQQYVKLGYVKLGTMFIDGHFIPYYGKLEPHKGYNTQRRIAMPGHYQNFTNDINGRPVFFYVNNSFVKFTDAIMNSVIDMLSLMAETGSKERLIVVFDRGGYDGKLFKELDSMGVGFITWQKFSKQCELSLLKNELSYTGRNGKEIKYLSYKRIIPIPNYRKDVEVITVYDENSDKQATMMNNLEYVGIMDKSDSYKIQVMDGRWVQENFFKEAKVKEDIDHQMGYQFEANSESGEDHEYYIINPEYAVLYEEIEKLERKQESYKNKREAVMERYQNLKRKKPLDEYLNQKSNHKIYATYDKISSELEVKRNEIKRMDAKIRYSDLRPERKDIFNTVRSSVVLALRCSVYNMRKRFEDIAREYFKDHRELSKFIVALTSSSATITQTQDCCIVRIKALDTPVYQKSAEKLINKLNGMDPRTVDGTNRRLVYII